MGDHSSSRGVRTRQQFDHRRNIGGPVLPCRDATLSLSQVFFRASPPAFSSNSASSAVQMVASVPAGTVRAWTDRAGND